MAIRINAKECCGDHCKIESDAHEFNTSSVEEEIREESCCSGKDGCCSDEWQDG